MVHGQTTNMDTVQTVQGEHHAYEGVEHHHIMRERKKDHGYSESTEGAFKQFGEDQPHGEHSEQMETFHNSLRKVGHASHPDKHFAK